MNGNIFGDRYRIEEKIGAGGMAEVFRAFDTTLNRTVAVKILHPQYAGEQNSIDRFKREAQAAANLNQPNIVNVYDWGAEGKTYYLVMEYLEGQNLKDVISSRGALPPNMIIEIGRKVAAALQAAHNNSIVHRDIKPHNIFITDQNEVKVTDFGIARSIAANVTQTSTVLGTAHYLSPEQAQSEEVGAASDIYSLGVVLYEMATGRVPFEGDSPVSVALKHIQQNAKWPSELNPDLPANLEMVIRKAMAKEPSKRHHSAADLSEDLRKCALGMPIQHAVAENENDQTMVLPKIESETSSTGDDEPKPRRWWIALLAAALALVFVGSAVGTSALLNNMTRYKVPKLSGLTEKQAKKALGLSKLKLKVARSVFHETVGAKLIIDQDPAAGEELRSGETVTVRVSRGKEMRKIPDLTNKILNQATFDLSRLGLNIGEIRREFSDTITEDYVIIQDPPIGRTVAKGTYINLVISRGARPIQTPNLIGKGASEAQAIIENEGLISAKLEEFDEDEEAGVVITQSPAAGVPVDRGGTVTITVSKGPDLIGVPDVTGLESTAAKSKLENAGFSVTMSESVSAPDAHGRVVTQEPEGGAKARKKSSVTIWIGTEPDP